MYLPSAKTEGLIAPKRRRKHKDSEPDQGNQVETYDDQPDDDLDDSLLMPPTTDEIESLPWDSMNLYLPQPTQENY